MKDCNVKIDGENIFDQPVKNDKETQENIRKITTGQEYDYRTGCLIILRKLENSCNRFK